MSFPRTRESKSLCAHNIFVSRQTLDSRVRGNDRNGQGSTIKIHVIEIGVETFDGEVILSGAEQTEASFCVAKDRVGMSAYIYIMGSRTHVLYTGVTNDLTRRVAEHKSHSIPGFTRKYNVEKYNVDRLFYYEELPDIVQAIAREKQIKGWTREKKLALIQSLNPDFLDLAEQASDPFDKLRAGPSLRISPLRSETLRSG